MIPLINESVANNLMNQYAIKMGLKKIGKQGEEAVPKELNQLHLLITFSPVEADKLSRRRKRKHLYL